MRAVVLTGAGGPQVLTLREVATPEPQGAEVRVRVAAAGVNRADIFQRRGGYAAPPGVPADIPGLEFSGVVEALGPLAREVAIGDRVCGIVAGGAYAEALVTHERTLIPIPPGIETVPAAAIPEAYLTAYDGLAQAGAGPGAAVLIHAAASGVGIAAVRLVTTSGGRAIGTTRSAWKRERILAHGAVAAVALEEAVEAAHAATGGAGVDAVLDLVGAPTLATNVAALRTGGTIVAIGSVAGRRAELDYGALMGKRARLIGTTLRARPIEEKIALAQRFIREVLPRFAAGTLAPEIDATFPLAEVAAAHERMERDENVGKILLTL